MILITNPVSVMHIGQCLRIQDAQAALVAYAVGTPRKSLAAIYIPSANAAVGTPLLRDMLNDRAWSGIGDTPEGAATDLTCGCMWKSLIGPGIDDSGL